jgi:hypothetical protein
MNTRIFCAIRLGLVSLFVAALVIGCQKQNDAVTQAEKADNINAVAVPSIEETKAIAFSNWYETFSSSPTEEQSLLSIRNFRYPPSVHPPVTTQASGGNL